MRHSHRDEGPTELTEAMDTEVREASTVELKRVQGATSYDYAAQTWRDFSDHVHHNDGSTDDLFCGADADTCRRGNANHAWDDAHPGRMTETQAITLLRQRLGECANHLASLGERTTSASNQAAIEARVRAADEAYDATEALDAEAISRT